MIEKDLGFVLKRYNFRETSLIANLYTLKFGKIAGILKGFYTSKKEFSSGLDVFSLNEIVFYPKKREIWLISFADLVRDYYFLRKNISKACIAAIFFSLLDRTMQPWDRNPFVFYLVRDCLAMLENEQEEKILYIFLIKFLSLSGFKPEFSRCIVCHKDIEEEAFLSISRGGLVCTNCDESVDDVKKISKETVSSLLYIQNNAIALVLRLNPTFECEKEIFYILREFICHHLDFDIFLKNDYTDFKSREKNTQSETK